MFPFIVSGTAYAAGLADIGAGLGYEMWDDVCTILPYCGQGASGVMIITGMIIQAALWVIGAGAVLIILYAAARIITYGANDQSLPEAKKMILYACLGLIFAVLGSTIVNYLFSLIAGIASAV